MSVIIQRFFKSQLAKGFLATLIGSGTSKVILMLATFIFTHILTKDDFGCFSFMRNTLNMILCVCALNYVGLVTKYTTELEYKSESKSRIVLVILFSLSICLMIGSTLLFLPDSMISRIAGVSSLVIPFRIAGSFLPVFMLQPLIEGILRGYKEFKLIGLLQIATAICFVLFVVIGSITNGVNGAIYGLLLYYFIYAIISLCVIVKKSPIISLLRSVSIFEVKKESKILWTMIFPVFLLSFVEAPVNWWAQVIMTEYDTIGSVGGMFAILQIRNLLIIVPNYFFGTFTSFQASLNVKGNQQLYFRNLQRAFLVCMFVGVIGTLLLSFWGDFVLGLYGASYKNDLNAFYVAMASFPLLICVSLMKSSLLIKEHQRVMLVTSVFASVLLLVTIYVLLPLGVKPVSAYYWGQMTYYVVTFVAFGICCMKDKMIIKK